MKTRVSIIAAIGGKTRALGGRGKLLWHISSDLKRFKELTTGHPIIMGRKTFESIGRPLPNRTNIVITRNSSFNAQGVVSVPCLEDALEMARGLDQEEIFIIGGGEIYKEALPFTDRLYLTLVHGEFADADTFFPDYSQFTKVISHTEELDPECDFSLLTLEK